MGLKIKEVAKLSGITVRTLHYYDEIGLLSPSDTTLSGYRLYDKDALERLRQILFFKELDFSLKEIKKIITSPSFNKVEALHMQKTVLKKKRDRLNGLIALVDKAITGETEMNFNAFDMSEVEESKKRYAKEVKDRWGHSEEYAESQRRTSKYTPDQWQALSAESQAVVERFAELRGSLPDSDDVMELVKKWQALISKYFYDCTNEILAGLGQMYMADDRFKVNIDRYGEGTAEFMASAIESYCGQTE